MKQGKTLAVFDFDGTITTKDTFLPFLLFSFGWFKTFAVLAWLAPAAALCLGGFISRKKYKEMIFRRTIKGWTKEKFRQTAAEFYEKEVKKLLKQSALDEIRRHLENGADVSLVSASPEDWLWPFTDEMKMNLIATRLEIKDGVYTGMIIGNNCRKAEKVSRINEVYDTKEYSDIYAYGDSSGDTEMLAMSNHPFFRYFK